MSATYIVRLYNATDILVRDVKFRNGFLIGTKIADVVGRNEDGSPIFRECQPEFKSGWDYTATHLYKDSSILPKAVDLLFCVVPSPGYNNEAECFGITSTFVFGVPYGTSEVEVSRIIDDAKILVASKGVGTIQKVYQTKLNGSTHNIIIDAFKGL